MIKNVKAFVKEALLNDEQFRLYLENSESELIRGISTITILSIIRKYGDEGIYGYLLMKEMETVSDGTLMLEEGSLYPMLKKMEREKLLKSQKKSASNRIRNYYIITDFGINVLNYLSGYFIKMTDSVRDLVMDENSFFCPNCFNRTGGIDDKKTEVCVMCGLNTGSYKK